jgi:simple sugar transport system permease protein
MPERIRHLTGKHEFWLLVVILVLGAALSLATDSFLTLQNMQDLITSNAFTGTLCAGLLVVLISGGIDISFTATASIAEYVAMTIANEYGGNWFTVFAIAAAVGLACGLVNAVVVRACRIPSIIATIATLNIFFGLLVYVTGGKYIYSLPDWFASGVNLFAFRDAQQNYYSLNLQMIVLVVTLVVTWFILNRMRLGRQIYALGGNADAAQRIGLNVARIQFFVYGYMGLIAGVASLLDAQLSQSVAPTVLVGRELNVLAAVVLGGASLLGGVGSVSGTILGLVLLAVIQNGLILVGVSSYWSQLLVGLVILIAVSATALHQKRQRAQVLAA